MKTQIEKEVVTFLKTLGSGPNKIAENLAEKGIKGTIGDANNCPIAKAIKKQFKGLKDVHISTEVEFTYKKEDYCFDYPNAVEKFIQKFDAGEYPSIATKNSLLGVL